MNEHPFRVGSGVLVTEDAPDTRHSAVFEDDGETGYFYAVDLSRSDETILDAVHIYNVANVMDRECHLLCPSCGLKTGLNVRW